MTGADRGAEKQNNLHVLSSAADFRALLVNGLTCFLARLKKRRKVLSFVF
jgi:hypothetical protein